MSNTDPYRAHTLAVIKLLLGERMLAPGLAITAGDVLGARDQIELAQAAKLSATDVVHLGLATTASGAIELATISLFAPRDEVCYVHTGCRLWLNATGRRGLILPRAEARGHFRVAPGEVIHVDNKPALDLSDGIARARSWLAEHLKQQTPTLDGVELHDVRGAA